MAEVKDKLVTVESAKAIYDSLKDKVDNAVKDIDFPVDSVNGKTGAVTLGASDVGAVPTSRTVNGKALSSNITLAASDVGARPNTWMPSAADVGAQPALGFTPVQQGLDDGSGNSKIRLAWNPYNDAKSALIVSVDGTNTGRVVTDNPTFGGIAPIANGGTGATDAATARTNLGAAPANIFINGTKNTDFNTITKPGWYWCQLASCTNTPVGDNVSGYGYLEVICPWENEQVLQRFTEYSSGRTWVRSAVNGWQYWQRIDSRGTLSVDRGGTGVTSLLALKNALGFAETFNAYYIDTSISNTLESLKANWSSFAYGSFMLTLRFIGGSIFSYIGYKIDENYGAIIELSYGSGAIYKYTVYNGTWSEFAHT